MTLRGQRCTIWSACARNAVLCIWHQRGNIIIVYKYGKAIQKVIHQKWSYATSLKFIRTLSWWHSCVYTLFQFPKLWSFEILLVVHRDFPHKNSLTQHGEQKSIWINGDLLRLLSVISSKLDEHFLRDSISL